MVMKIYTRTGDKGHTGLFGGGRVPKDDRRVACYGDVDELNAQLGVCATLATGKPMAELLAKLQSLLFDLGAELATAAEAKHPPPGMAQDQVTWLESEIDRAEDGLGALKTFILPGGCPLAAGLHVARAVCRRAERACVSLVAAEPRTSPTTVIVLNRISDLLFVLARRANHEAGVSDVPWSPR